LFTRKTWIGYAVQDANLPSLPIAVIQCNGIPSSSIQQLPKESLQMMDYWYARDYDPIKEIKMIKKMYRYLGG